MVTKVKIAIANDHPMLLKRMKMLLAEKGHEVIIEAGNGAALIIQILNSARIPNVCILDGKMPIMCGSETTMELKNRWPEMKIIGFSLDSKKGEDMLRMGAAAFVPKTNPEMLLETVERIMGIV
jgi:two-component system invasion response regulator UvrY